MCGQYKAYKISNSFSISQNCVMTLMALNQSGVKYNGAVEPACSGVNFGSMALVTEVE